MDTMNKLGTAEPICLDAAKSPDHVSMVETQISDLCLNLCVIF